VSLKRSFEHAAQHTLGWRRAETASGQPVGREYLAKAAKILPGGQLHGDEAHAWAVRVNGRPALDLHLLLAHQTVWPGAIANLRDRLLELQRQRDITAT
jgi:hypothetical protein